jgi:tRNA(Ile)-lysidine synthase
MSSGQAAPALVRRVRDAVEEAGLRDTSLVVAVSGGADSLALLGALAAQRAPLGLTLTVAHLDHGLRPASPEDARFVAEVAHQQGFPCVVERADVREHQRRHRLSLEDAARRVRYDFLARTAQRVGAAAVALGHTADDQAETLLLHLVQGSGLPGLRGMTPVSRYRGPEGRWPKDATVTLLRPLLEVGREETEAACDAWGLTPRQDETNSLPDSARNYLRLEVLPRLARLNPRVREALGRMAGAVAMDLDYLEERVEEVWTTVAAGDMALDVDALRALHPALQRHLLRQAYRRTNGDLQGLRQHHLEAMVRLLEGPTGAVVELPHGLRLERQRDRALLTRGQAEPPLPPLEGGHLISVPGEIFIGGEWRVCGELAPPSMALDLGPYTAVLDADALGGPLEVRRRRLGDRFQPLGAASALGERKRDPQGKKLQDFMVDAHIPRSWRNRVPLLVAPQGVAWVVGWRIAHWARVTPETRRRVVVTFSRKPGPLSGGGSG